MTLAYVIQQEQQTGLRVKSVFVIIRNDDPIPIVYRRCEVLMPLAANVETFIDGLDLGGLWLLGDDSDEGAYLSPGEKELITPVYAPIVLQIFQALAGPASIDVILGKIDTLLQQSPAAYAKFNTAMSKLGIDTDTLEGKREMLNWAVVLALVGFANSDAG